MSSALGIGERPVHGDRRRDNISEDPRRVAFPRPGCRNRKVLQVRLCVDDPFSCRASLLPERVRLLPITRPRLIEFVQQAYCPSRWQIGEHKCGSETHLRSIHACAESPEGRAEVRRRYRLKCERLTRTRPSCFRARGADPRGATGRRAPARCARYRVPAV